MQVNVCNVTGEAISQLEVNDYLFNTPIKTAVMHQSMVCQLNNARQGTRDTKTRGEVAGSTRKLYPQKHTGRARRGDIKSPLLKGGGIVFGPHPRDYHRSLNKKMRGLALRSALSAKIKEEKFIILDSLELGSRKTKEMVGVVRSLGLSRKALFVTAAVSENLALASRNIPGVKVIALDSLNLVDLLSYDHLVMTVDAVKKAEEIWAKPAPPVEVKGRE